MMWSKLYQYVTDISFLPTSYYVVSVAISNEYVNFDKPPGN